MAFNSQDSLITSISAGKFIRSDWNKITGAAAYAAGRWYDMSGLNGTPVAYQPISEELLRYIPAAERQGRVFASEKLPGQTHAVGGYPAAPAPRTFAPIVVPPGEYFMMGDNRDDSFDSRFYGPVKREKIVGRAITVVLSFDKSNYWLPRWGRSFSSLVSGFTAAFP